jgi:hypothetical protein
MPRTVATQPQQRGQSPQQAAPQALVPFVAGAHEHTEPFVDVAVTPSTVTQNLGPYDVPAYGYLRHVWLEITTTTAGTGGTASADYPFNFFQQISLNDVNGAPIYGPLDGYATLWANILGGYAFRADPRTAPMYSATTTAPSFWIRVPIEVSHHDGLGALPNQNATSNYKLNLSINPLATMYTVNPAPVPVMRIRAYLEAWSLPNSSDVVGRPQMQVPPMVGTTQYWSQFVKNINAGYQTTLLPRVGNLIRNLLFISRNVSGARVNTVFPDPAILGWDARDMLNDTQNYRTSVGHERLVPLAAALDTGVFLYALDHSDKNQAGDDNATLWYQTVQATRLELKGTSAVAGTIQCITNDIAPVEVDSAQRYIEGSDTGFTPGLGGPVPAS